MSEAGKSILQGAREALAYAKGNKRAGKATAVRVPARVDVQKIRHMLRLSQSGFAARFGFSVSTVRDWEQHRRKPDAPSRVLLIVIASEPEAVERALRKRQRA